MTYYKYYNRGAEANSNYYNGYTPNSNARTNAYSNYYSGRSTYTPEYNGYSEKGTYNYDYGVYTYLNTKYLREERVANLDDPTYAHLYQKTTNYDYMTHDKYYAFKPQTYAY